MIVQNCFDAQLSKIGEHPCKSDNGNEDCGKPLVWCAKGPRNDRCNHRDRARDDLLAEAYVRFLFIAIVHSCKHPFHTCIMCLTSPLLG